MDLRGDGRRQPAGTPLAWRRAREWGRSLVLAALPFLIMATLAALDLLTRAEFLYLPLLSLGPTFAAVASPPAQTVLAGGVAGALWLPMVSNDGLLGSWQGYVALATIAGSTLAGVLASVARHGREQELANVRAVADMAQRVLLRPVHSEVDQIQVAARYISAAPSARIGGDLYDVVVADGALRLVVGDVQGKGLMAVQTAAVVLGAFREAAYDEAGLAGIARRIELSLQRQAPDEEFVTAVLAQIPKDGTVIEILNCGHPSPLLLRAGAAQFAEPPQAALPLGLSQVARARREPYARSFAPGDQMLFYTDGISEARDRSGAFFPLDRCRVMLNVSNPEEALEWLQADVVSHVGGALRDDAAMLLVRRWPGSPGSASG